MKIRRRIPCALSGFLNTYVSRYTELNGFWLFGQLVQEVNNVKFTVVPLETALHAAIFARKKILEQLEKNRIPIKCIESITLQIDKKDEPAHGWVTNLWKPGNMFLFTVRAKSDLHKIYEYNTKVFVAPHDPNVEGQNAEEDRTPLLR